MVIELWLTPKDLSLKTKVKYSFRTENYSLDDLGFELTIVIDENNHNRRYLLNLFQKDKLGSRGQQLYVPLIALDSDDAVWKEAQLHEIADSLRELGVEELG